jgi:hypothetical protein
MINVEASNAICKMSNFYQVASVATVSITETINKGFESEILLFKAYSKSKIKLRDRRVEL